MGSNVSGFAFPTVAVGLLGASATQMSLIATVQTLAFPLLGMFAATAVERANKARIMGAMDLGRAMTVLAIPVLALLHALSVNALVFVSAIIAVMSVFRDVASQALVPAVVPAEDLAKANASIEVSNTASLSVGPALGGVLINLVGGPLAMLVDALAYFGSAATLFGMRMDHVPGRGSEREPFLRSLVAGLQWIIQAPKLGRIACCAATLNLTSSASQVVAMIYFYRVLHMSPLMLGVLFGIANLGIVGAWCAARLERRAGLIAALELAVLITAVGRFLLPLAAGSAYPLLLAGAALLVSSFAAPLFNVVQLSYRQRITPLPMQARMHAAMRTINSSTVPIGSMLGGVLAAAFGPTHTLYVCAFATLLAVAWLVPRGRAIEPSAMLAAAA